MKAVLMSIVPQFWMEETDDSQGVVCLALVGELDLDAEASFAVRLRSLRRERAHVRLDVSRLTFIDVAGLRAVAAGLSDARRDGWELEIGRDVTQPVRRMIELAGAGAVLWP